MIEYRSQLSGLSLKYILRHAELSFEQLAKLCGVSRRQLSYWIDNGLVPSPAADPLATLEKATLIRVRLDQGDTLRQAAQRVASYYERYRSDILRLEQMSDEERGHHVAKQLEELQQLVSQTRQVLAESSTPPFSIQALVTVLRNMALNELLTMLPHSRPTPDVVIRLYQSIGHLRLLLTGSGFRDDGDSTAP